MSSQRVQRMYAPVLDVKASKRIIEGLAVPYEREQLVSDDGGATSYVESWARRSFESAALPANRGRTSLLYTHLDTPLNRLGRPLDLRDAPDGLHGEWKVDETPMGDVMLELVRDEKLKGLSISALIRGTVQRGKVKVRTQGVLEHVALVEEPAYEEALVTAVRAAQAPAVSAALWTSRLARLRGERAQALNRVL